MSAKSKYGIKRPKSHGKNATLAMSLVKGQIYGLLITAVLFLMLALILTYTFWLENPTAQNVALILVTVLAVVIAGYKVAKSYCQMGWLWGGITGMIYFVIFILLSYLVQGAFSMSTNLLSMILLCLGSGALGGVLGAKKEE